MISFGSVVYSPGFLGSALTILFAASLFTGVTRFGFWEVFTNSDAAQLMIVSRIPRTLAAVLTGAALAISGQILQSLVRNRFVEPMTTGSGQGAAIGLLTVSILFPGLPIFYKMIIATMFALLTSIGFILICHRFPPSQPLLVPLAGLAYGGILGAAATFVAFQYDLLQYLGIWLNGELSGLLLGRYELLWFAGLAAILAYIVADQFAIAGLGRTISTNLGLNYRNVMAIGLLTVSVVTSVTILTIGLIPFIGLVVPNIVSRHFGDNLRKTIPITMAIGAIMVLLSDILGRLLRYPYEIPVSTILGLTGSVVFLWLLYARPGNAH